MNSSSITDYILKLEKENAEARLKIEQLKKEESDKIVEGVHYPKMWH